MNFVSEHLTSAQLQAYRGKSLTLAERREANRHLLQCEKCLAALLAPTPEQYLAAMFEENKVDDLSNATSGFDKNDVFNFFSKSLWLFALKGSVALAAVLLGLTLLTWFALSRKPQSGIETAKLVETEFDKSVLNESYDEVRSQQNVQIIESVESKDVTTVKKSNRSEPNRVLKTDRRSRELSISEKSTTQPNLNAETKGKFSPTTKTVFAFTRGKSKNCSDEDAVETEIASVENKTVLRWKKIANATKYHIYVSDNDEILVDEYETQQETSYVLKKPLDPLKDYRWKIVVTLNDGKMVVGDSQKFTLKGFRNKRKSLEKKGFEIRCSKKN